MDARRISASFLLLLLSSVILGEQSGFDGYQVWRVNVRSRREFEVMEKLQRSTSDKFDFWDFPHDVMTAPSDTDDLRETLAANNMEYSVMIEDVQSIINEEEKQKIARLQKRGDQEDDLFEEYQRYSKIDSWVESIKDKYPDLAEDIIIGQSFEKRNLRALRIGTQAGKARQAMWIQSGLHAREWVGPAANMWMTNQMLNDYGLEDVITRLLDNYDVYILILSNPDGYEYTHEDTRLWRKTRSVNPNESCIGVDPNRNWPYEWGLGGISFNPCSDIYCGEEAMSELEIASIVNFITETSKKQEFVLFLDIHSYSQLILSPWAYTSEHSEDYTEHMNLGKIFSEALEKVEGTNYRYGTVPDVLYVASGSSIDWAYGKLGIKYSHCIELRDNGEYGFILPADQIIPTANETYAGMKATYDYVMAHT